jgi:hypothetical protein
MLDQIKGELYPACITIKSSQASVHNAFWRAWSFVDTVHRIREVAQNVPGLSSKNHELRIFLSSTSIAEDFRHYIQHLRQELSKVPGNALPVWGSLSWVDPNDPMLCHTALAGAQLPNMRYAGCVYDRVEGKWVSAVGLSVGDLSFNFDPIYDSCSRFRGFIIPWLHKTFSPGIRVDDNVPVMSFRIVEASA